MGSESAFDADQNRGHWDRVGELFDSALALPSESREAWLREQCGDATDLFAEVISLLGYEGQTIPGLEGGLSVVQRDFFSATAPEPGKRIGPYRIIRQIGQGGMGAVYEGLREDQFQKRVAIKLIRFGLEDAFARERFLHERQILARLDHPNIAVLLDGGSTPQGLPYLVMEFVEGQPLLDAAANLTVREKVELFRRVLLAVAFAHRNLVVHRDLKPGNILVTAQGEPKLLDFGVAKLLGPGDTGATANYALTPEYASPEQLRGEPISTATDIYSLGVLLFRLLTGRRPYELGTRPPAEVERIICEQPPAPPNLGDELDQIILMALRKEPARRYSSAEVFAEDLGRYLDNRPVMARPDTIRYRTRKYVSRHWLMLSAALIALTGVVVGVGAVVYEAQVQQRQFRNGRRLANMLMFEVDASLARTPGTVEARRRVVQASLEYLNGLSGDAGRDEGLQWDLAVAYSRVAAAQWSEGPSLGLPIEAVASYEKAFRLARPMADRGALERTQLEQFVNMLTAAGVAAGHARDRQAAARLGQEAVQRSQGLSAAVRLNALNEYSATMTVSGNLLAAESALSQVVAATREQLPKPASREATLQLVQRLANLIVAQQRVTRLEEARASAAEAAALVRPLATKDDLQAIRLLHGVLVRGGDVEGARDRPSLGNPDGAVAMYRESVSTIMRLASLDPHDKASRTLAGIGNLKTAWILTESDPAKALGLANDSISVLDSAENAEFRALPRIVAARACRLLHRHDESARWLTEAQEILSKPGTNSQADLDFEWALLEAARGNTGEASRWFATAIADHEALYKRTPTPSYAFNLTAALDAAATAIPESAVKRYGRMTEVWEEQNRLFPGHPYIVQRLDAARTKLHSR